jgi:hypothetical protein
MDAPTLMHKLMEMDRALERRDSSSIRNLILEAQEGVRALERENEELAVENAGLRQRLDAAHHSTLPYSAHARPAQAASNALADEAFLRQILSGEALAPEALAPKSQFGEALSADPTTEDDPANGDPPRTHLWRTTHFFFS